MMRVWIGRIWIGAAPLLLLVLVASWPCRAATREAAPVVRDDQVRDDQVRDAHTPCDTELGREAADRLQRTCQGVSPATHPPCGMRNSCASMRQEIARACSLDRGKDGGHMPGCRPLRDREAAATGALHRFYDAIDERDFATAYALLRPDAGKKPDFAAFRAGFARTRVTHVTQNGPVTFEGAAGSTYATIPVTVDATLIDGTRRRLAGAYVLRLVNVPDASWHIFSSDLHEDAGH